MARIKAGILARVVSGVNGDKSPNIGLIVKVLSYQGEHSQHGPIWRCSGEYTERAQEGVDVPAGTADYAQSWLVPIEPPKQEGKAKGEKKKDKSKNKKETVDA